MKVPLGEYSNTSQKAFSVYNDASCCFIAGSMGRTRAAPSPTALGPGGGFHLS